MRDINAILAQFREISTNPHKQLDKITAEGKKAVGCIPYFYPEELVSACGMVPFGLWGAEMEVTEAKAYYPAFICSLLQTILEQGIRGMLDKLSAVIIPLSCDSMKNMRLNWACGVPQVPFIDMPMAQNRKIEGGKAYTTAVFRKIQAQLAEISGYNPSDDDIQAAIASYNKNRKALREFSALAGKHPELVTPSARCGVIKARYFMEVAEHTAMVEELNALLAEAPVEKWKGYKVVTTGIIADSKDLLKIFEDNKIAIVDDEVTHESIYFREDTPVLADPVRAMAERIGNIEGCSVLYDPGKKRAHMLVDIVKASGAQGVVFVMTKFCDPEEYDFVPVKKALADAGIPLLQIEVDQQMKNYEQARSAIETFVDIME